MKNFDLALVSMIAIGGGFLLGTANGVNMERERATAAAMEAWEQVIVVRNGVEVTNPAALKPRELARSQIIDKAPRLIGFGCEGMGTLAMIAEEEDEFPKCKDIRAVE